MTPADLQATFAATLVDEWVRAGVRDAVVAPGSRSTPVLLAVARDGRLRVHVVLDERSAGFVALGLGLATGRPAVVVTTSGTAAVELHPSVVEAHHAGVPLLAVTADRPPELQGVGAPQTVEQGALFGSAVRWSAAPGVADAGAQHAWRSLAGRAVLEATAGPGGPGPVHLNLAFREPLLGQAGPLPAGRDGGRPWHDGPRGDRSGAAPPGLAERLSGVERGLVVAGGGSGDPTALRRLAEALDWPVLADPRSGCRIPHPLTIAAADALVRTEQIRAWRPEIVLRFGQPWASRVLNTWLGALGADVEQVLVDPFGTWADPERISSTVLGVGADVLADAVAAVGGARTRPGGGWTGRWQAAEAAAQQAIREVIGRHREVTEPGVARTLVGALPEGTTLFVSSSMPVRDVEWFAAPRAGVRVVSNRGANGIDGVLSTALGVALAEPEAPVVALIGDLSFLYDSGALLWARSRGVRLTYVVVDNDGGGIFSFLPQAAALPAELFERLWATPHRSDLRAIAAAQGLGVTSVPDGAALAPAVLDALDTGGVHVVIASTDRGSNVAVHDELQQEVGRRVDALGSSG